MKREKAFTAKLARALLDLQLAPDRQTAIDLATKACKCGARTKKGTPCQRSGLLPSLRCIKHGGQHFKWITPEGREAMQKASRGRWERRRAAEAEEAKLRGGRMMASRAKCERTCAKHTHLEYAIARVHEATRPDAR